MNNLYSDNRNLSLIQIVVYVLNMRCSRVLLVQWIDLKCALLVFLIIN